MSAISATHSRGFTIDDARILRSEHAPQLWSWEYLSIGIGAAGGLASAIGGGSVLQLTCSIFQKACLTNEQGQAACWGLAAIGTATSFVGACCYDNSRVENSRKIQNLFSGDRLDLAKGIDIAALLDYTGNTQLCKDLIPQLNDSQLKATAFTIQNKAMKNLFTQAMKSIDRLNEMSESQIKETESEALENHFQYLISKNCHFYMGVSDYRSDEYCQIEDMCNNLFKSQFSEIIEKDTINRMNQEELSQKQIRCIYQFAEKNKLPILMKLCIEETKEQFALERKQKQLGKVLAHLTWPVTVNP